MVGLHMQRILKTIGLEGFVMKDQFIMRVRSIDKRIAEKKAGLKRNHIIKKSNKILKRIKLAHEGQRCYIIGNGPSLRVDDLNKLKSSITFATNRIYRVFGQTNWRPTYYCVQDFELIKNSAFEINKVAAKKRFVGYYDNSEFDLLRRFAFIRLYLKPFYPDYPRFSEDLLFGIYEGFTVTYMCIQIAAFMGFREIVLLGIDHNYSAEILPNGHIKHNNLEKDHFDVNDKVDNLPQLYKSTLAYKAAKQYCEKNSIRVYNATRGGKLDVFERVCFDDIIDNDIIKS